MATAGEKFLEITIQKQDQESEILYKQGLESKDMHFYCYRSYSSLQEMNKDLGAL